MADSFDDEEPSDGRSTLWRVVEGLTVAAFVLAVIVWQSDGTLSAARRLVAEWGFGTPAAPEVDAPQQDIRLAERGSDVPPLDMTATGSLGRAAPPLAISLDEAPPMVSSPPPDAAGWRAACASGICTASQNLAFNGDPTLETSWTIEKGENGVVAIWTTPTDVVVGRGMTLALGDGAARTVPFDSCGAHSCEVRAKLAPEFLAQLKRTGTAKTGIVLRDGRSVGFEFSPNGLAEALAKLGV